MEVVEEGRSSQAKGVIHFLPRTLIPKWEADLFLQTCRLCLLQCLQDENFPNAELHCSPLCLQFINAACIQLPILVHDITG